MKSFLTRLHARVGDFWWYSAMLFCACRFGDCINLFVGLWLVPKYVDPTELGAVTPLTSVASFIALPAGIFGTVFMKEVTDLANAGKLGQLKSLMRGVFIGAGVLLVLMTVGTLIALPLFLERIRVASGSLAIVIVLLAFTNAFGPIYGSATTALKKFKTISALTLLGAPLRFLTMLVTMPYRALTGYFAGQAAPGLFGIVASVWAVRKELAVKAEPYWNRESVKKMTRLFIAIGIAGGIPTVVSLIESVIIRQRLPDMDSAAYYMIGRFNELASIASATLSATIFPFTAELSAKGKSMHPIIFKASGATLVFAGAAAIFFGIFGGRILSWLPYGAEYASYDWAIPWLIIIMNLNCFQGFYTTAETSAGRFGFLWWWAPMHVIYGLGLLFVTGYGYFTQYLPPTVNEFLAHHNINSLEAVLWCYTLCTFFKLLFTSIDMGRQARHDRYRIVAA